LEEGALEKSGKSGGKKINYFMLSKLCQKQSRKFRLGGTEGSEQNSIENQLTLSLESFRKKALTRS